MYAEVLPQWRTLYVPGRHGSPEFPGFTETEATLSSYSETKASTERGASAQRLTEGKFQTQMWRRGEQRTAR